MLGVTHTQRRHKRVYDVTQPQAAYKLLWYPSIRRRQRTKVTNQKGFLCLIVQTSMSLTKILGEVLCSGLLLIVIEILLYQVIPRKYDAVKLFLRKREANLF